MNDVATDDPLELNIRRMVDVPARDLFRGWTEPDLLVRWFTPAPWTTSDWKIDLRPGGACDMVMHGPNGEEFANRGVYLEVVPDRKLVFTDAFVEGWLPSEKPFMVGHISFDEENGRTCYTARVFHWTQADRDQHVAMGFYEGWGKCLDQLLAVTRDLSS